jgi:hypothetical protein
LHLKFWFICVDVEGHVAAQRADLRSALASRVSIAPLIGRGDRLHKGAMTLPGRQREALALRARLSIVYAAVWAFGGAANSTDRRRCFDSDLRDIVEKYFPTAEEGHTEPSIEMALPTDCSLFECVLDLPGCAIKPALELDPRTLSALTVPGIPKKFEPLHVYAELLAGSRAERTAFGVLDRLVFRTPSTRAVDAALRRLLSTGANIVLFGDKGCGKSQLVTDILSDLKVNLPTPQKMREQVNQNLVDIVNGAKKSEGIFAALEILKYILSKFATAELKDDAQADFQKMWDSAGEGLKVSVGTLCFAVWQFCSMCQTLSIVRLHDS